MKKFICLALIVLMLLPSVVSCKALLSPLFGGEESDAASAQETDSEGRADSEKETDSKEDTKSETEDDKDTDGKTDDEESEEKNEKDSESEDDEESEDIKESDDVEDSEEEETESKSAIEDTELEKRDYSGEEYQIVYSKGKSQSWDPYPVDVTADEATSGNKIYKAGYQRDYRFKKDFNITLKWNRQNLNPNMTGKKEDQMISYLRAAALAEAEDFDMVFTGAKTAGTLALEGFWFDLKNSDYINADAYYYETQVNNQLQIDGHQFFASGYYSATNTSAIDITYANLDALASIDADIDSEYLYNLVVEHQWTLDKMLQIGKAYATPDANMPIVDEQQNSTTFDSDNQYALILSKKYCQNIYYDLGGDVIKYNENTYDYDVVVSNTENQNLFDYIKENVTNNPNVILAPNDSHAAAFMKQAAPFMVVTYINIVKFADTEFDWTILPAPLRYEGDEYRAYSDGWNLNLAGIPRICDDVDKATYLYEMFMAYSYDYVYPAYYEESFGSTYQPDLQSCKVFDIVSKSRVVCPANVYGWFGNTEVATIIANPNSAVGSSVKVIFDDVSGKMGEALDKFNESVG